MISTLVVDCGASSTKWAAGDSAGLIRKGSAGFLTGHIFNDAEWERVKEVLRDIAGKSPRVLRIIAGVTGLERGTLIADELSELFTEVFQVDDVEVCNDIELAHSAFFEPGEGILIYGGTGSVAVTRTASREVVRAGGWGFIIGDEGGGFWIGREALRHLTDLWDLGKDTDTSLLATKILSVATPSNWNGMREYVYKGGRQAVAALAPIVGEAKRSGSEEAAKILSDASSHLAQLAKRLLTRVRTNQFAAMGGVFKLDPIVIERLRSELGNTIEYFEGDIPDRWLEKHRGA